MTINRCTGKDRWSGFLFLSTKGTKNGKLRQKLARENSVSERSPVYSGMMGYEKAARELPFLGFMFEK